MTSSELLLVRANEAEQFAYGLLEFARNLRSQTATSDEPRLFWPESDARLAEVAGMLARFRRQRSKHLDSSLFAEPAWDMLLTLFHTQETGSEMLVSDLRTSSGSSESTAGRWIDVLKKMSLVELVYSRLDSRQGLCPTN